MSFSVQREQGTGNLAVWSNLYRTQKLAKISNVFRETNGITVKECFKSREQWNTFLDFRVEARIKEKRARANKEGHELGNECAELYCSLASCMFSTGRGAHICAVIENHSKGLNFKMDYRKRHSAVSLPQNTLSLYTHLSHPSCCFPEQF